MDGRFRAVDARSGRPDGCLRGGAVGWCSRVVACGLALAVVGDCALDVVLHRVRGRRFGLPC